MAQPKAHIEEEKSSAHMVTEGVVYAGGLIYGAKHIFWLHSGVAFLSEILFAESDQRVLELSAVSVRAFLSSSRFRDAGQRLCLFRGGTRGLCLQSDGQALVLPLLERLWGTWGEPRRDSAAMLSSAPAPRSPFPAGGAPVPPSSRAVRQR